MQIELTASKVDPKEASGNVVIIKIRCSEKDYDRALEIVEKFSDKKDK